MNDGDMVDPTYARTDDYRGDLEEIRQAGVCPFCPESMHWHPKPILRREGGWLITEIREKYPNARLHFLLIGNRHIENFTQLSEDDFISIQDLIGWAEEEFDIEGGGILMRFGSTRLTGASVVHLHMHLIVPEIDPETDRAIPVWFPVG